ncbi:MAG: efflux RND transporter periplasmic adaptor subunit [Propionivibrio sp.]|uniref:Efflux RND transporter periplasmic adaptor subunit n=1 Tax=Candidatus Propionivibrio dominans TaxID=2954373 RepID=A0A9D7I7M4_9RHOO|nr:efflux RND transporter periplasmic adaptor subunit [Candidatus Propionivibrio dominans]
MNDASQTPATTPLSRLKIDRSAASPKGKRRWGRWLVLALGIAALGVFALIPRKAEVQVTSVLMTFPSQQYAELTASGYVVAQRRAAVASKATGRLLELRVREGSVVKAGDLIARLDASDVRAAIVAAQAGQRQSEAAVHQAEASLHQARIEQANAAAELRRNEALVARGFVSPQALDTVRTRADVAQAAVGSAQAAIATAQAAVAQSAAQVGVQRVNADYTEIRAPFDGVVLVKNANVGDIITPFSSAAGTQGAVVTMADMSTLEVEADVSESNLAKAAIGKPVEITLDALPDTRFRGAVVGIVPTVDRAKATVMTKIRFDKLDPRILPEMSAKVTILSQAATDADQKAVLAVNPRAIVERDGRKLVLRLKDDTVEAVDVVPGRKIGDNVEIAGALQSGERLVLSPSDKVQAGTRVTVTAK